MVNTIEKNYLLYVGGKWIESRSGETMQSFNPSTGKAWSVFQYAKQEDVNHAIDVAHKTFLKSDWARMSPVERGGIIQKLAALLSAPENVEKIATVETKDWGRIFREAKAVVSVAHDYVNYYAGSVDKLLSNVNTLEKQHMLNYEKREPLGVIAGILPWNAPLILAIYKILPAIATGNVIVIKPSEHCSAPLLEFAKLFDEAGFPPGVLNVVTGDAATGMSLISDKRISKIAFTGSIRTGVNILKEIANNMITGIFELGGKSPNIVFDDADQEKAIKYALMIFKSSGQSCVAPSRLLVQKSIYEDFIRTLVQEAANIKVGDPFDEDTNMGPIATREQYEKVLKYIQIGSSEGANPILGGKPVRFDNHLKEGWFMSPTIFSGVNNKMKIAQEEIFGPVLSVMSFENEDDAIEIANETEYGLAAGIWTNNLSRAHRMASLINAGTIWVNTYHSFSVRTPFGGYKKSGFGRECGMEVLKEYTQLKNIVIDYA